MNMQSTTPAVEETVPSGAEASSNYLDQLREKILFGLSIYKFVNPSQLHVFLGTSTPTSLWKDQVLAQLIEEGKVIVENIQLTSPFARSQTYTVLHLPENPFTPPSSCAQDDQEPEPAVA